MTLPKNGNDASNSRFDDTQANSIKTGSRLQSEPIAEIESIEEIDIQARETSIKTGS